MTGNEELSASEIIIELQAAREWFTIHGRNTNTAIIGICDRAIALIKCQNAETKKLGVELQAVRGAANGYKAEIERYKGVIKLLEKDAQELRMEKQALKEESDKSKATSMRVIKRQDAEIERLNSELKATSCAALSYKEEIERLKEEMGTKNNA